MENLRHETGITPLLYNVEDRLCWTNHWVQEVGQNIQCSIKDIS